MAIRKHFLPSFLAGHVDDVTYEKWLKRKAATHVKRDRKRGLRGVTGAAYRDAIHEAVIHSGGLDVYTGEQLHWQLISQYNNEDSRDGRHHYKAKFALLPTVDHHFDASYLAASFQICSWRTNDAKNDLSIGDFRDLCVRILEHAGYRLESRPQNISGRK